MHWLGYSELGRVLLAATLLLVCQPAFAGKRVALVIANSAYQNVPTLPNPVNDGAVVAARLKEAGFDIVDSRHDLAALETRRALREFEDSARNADIAVVYYAGHGIEVDGTNYLIPVDAKLERDSDVYDEALSLDRVLLAVDPAKQLRLVILDACRDNPFAKTMKRSVAARGIGSGLAKIEPTSPNTLIAYSAKAGSTAQDGDGMNSPFTVALARHLTTPGLDVRKAFGFVRDDVLKSTGNRQEPFVYGSLGGEDVALVPARAAPSQPVANPQSDARRDYELAQQIGNKAAYNAYLTQYPDGFYASLARLQLEKLAAEEARVAATEKAQAAEAERARLAAAGAQQQAQAKAEADARAAEQQRLVAERAKQAAQDQADQAERKQAGMTAQPAPVAVDQSTAPAAPTRQTNVASLDAEPARADLTKSVQAELRRVGCLAAAADGDWNAASQRSLSLFNRYAGTKFDVKIASTDVLDAVKLKPSRVCPLVCDHGFRADGDHCSKIVCTDGAALNDDNECEKRRARPVAKRDDGGRPDRAARAPARIGRPQTSGSPGQIVCDDHLCRPVTRGCHIESLAQGAPRASGGNTEVCN